VPIKRMGKYGDSDGCTSDDPIFILEILSRMIKRFIVDDDLKNAQRSDKPKEQSSKITT
ncbi:hypothetical protein Tco_1058984, partial [Tanacetum coccineum]